MTKSTKKTKKPATLNRSDIGAVLRSAIEASGKTKSEIAEASGVSPGILTRFMAEERDITLATASRLMNVLGLEVR